MAKLVVKALQAVLEVPAALEVSRQVLLVVVPKVPR
jgi:hypothetical protein